MTALSTCCFSGFHISIRCSYVNVLWFWFVVSPEKEEKKLVWWLVMVVEADVKIWPIYMLHNYLIRTSIRKREQNAMSSSTNCAISSELSETEPKSHFQHSAFQTFQRIRRCCSVSSYQLTSLRQKIPISLLLILQIFAFKIRESFISTDVTRLWLDICVDL